MAGPVNVSAIAEAAVRVVPRAGESVDQMLPLTGLFDDAVLAPAKPRVVIVGIGRTPPKTTQSLIEAAAQRGLVPGEDIIATRYADLRVGAQHGFVRMAEGTGADGMVLAGKGREALFVFRGGGNLADSHLAKIGAIQSVDGATALTDLGFIQRAGSKSITYDRLHAAGLALADTVPVRGSDEAIAAFDRITGRFGADTAVLKKVNSLGGKDVHFVTSHDDIAKVIAKDPDAEFVMQEFLPHAKDQDVRVHMVWSHDTGDFEIANSYVRNRNAFQLTPNLANGGFPTHYELSPWEHEQAIAAARVLSEGSPNAPLHVGLDFFPRQPITASTVERNVKLQKDLAAGTITHQEALARSANSVVIGEAASSAGTKGTEMVLGQGNNPVVRRIVDEIMHIREHGVSRSSIADASNALDLLSPREPLRGLRLATVDIRRPASPRDTGDVASAVVEPRMS